MTALGHKLRVPVGWRLGTLLGTLLGGLLFTLVPAVVTLFLPDPYYNLHGFLAASPFIVLALWPSETHVMQDEPVTKNSELKTQNYLRSVTLLYVGIHALVISALSGLGPISRHEWGQRYLLPAYPALAVLALLAGWQIWTLYSEQFRRLAVAGLATVAAMLAVGIGLEARGYVMLREERAQVGEWLALVRTLPGREPLVTDVWWLPLNLAADFYTRPMMLAEGESRLREWAAQMRARGVESFGLMSQSDTSASALFAPQGYLPEGTVQESRGMWLQRYKLAQP
jgi:chromate transport protein ChrA